MDLRKLFPTGENAELPEDVIVQIRIRRVDFPEEGKTGIAAGFTSNIGSHMEAAAVLLALQGLEKEFEGDFTGAMAKLMMSGPDGSESALEAIQFVMENRGNATRVNEEDVARSGGPGN